MKTVPLRGAKAAGRVALVDDADYDLVMQYRWNVLEGAPQPGRHPIGPYAMTGWREGGRDRTLLMHTLITGWPMTDHEGHNGLNNQRSNLRPATPSQNQQNKRARISGSSRYKGLCWLPKKRKWLVTIVLNGRCRRLGEFVSELEAAYAYDQAARELFGEFAYTNFQDGPTQAERDQWQAERATWAASVAERRRANGTLVSERWKKRQPETRICTVCGDEYQSRATHSFYCDKTCRDLKYRQERECQREGKLF